MPKVSKKNSFVALRKARKLFAINTGSETEESVYSDDSEGNSHIPVKTEIPLEKLQLDDSEDSSEDDSEPKLEMEQIANQLAAILERLQTLNDNQQRQQQEIVNLQNAAPSNAPAAPRQNMDDGYLVNLSKIPDPIKSIPIFDGNRKQLSAWLASAENTLNLFRPHVNDTLYSVYVTAVTNKIQGKAKDILCLAGNPQDFDTVKEILINALGDRQELSTYKCQLWQMQMSDGMPIHKYYQRTKELVQNIKTLAKQKELYRNNWKAINEFIDEDGLAAFIAGLREPYFGYAQAARPADLEDAYAFLCKFKSKELTASYMADKSGPKKPNFQNGRPNKNFSQPPPQFENKKPDNRTQENFKNIPTPMEIDPSIRSRLTLNKKFINNHEAECSESENDETETEDLDINFQTVSKDLETS